MASTQKLKGQEFKDALAALGMTPSQAATFLGCSLRNCRRVINGSAELDRGETILLRLMIHLGFKVKAVYDMLGMDPPPKPAKKKAASAA